MGVHTALRSNSPTPMAHRESSQHRITMVKLLNILDDMSRVNINQNCVVFWRSDQSNSLFCAKKIELTKHRRENSRTGHDAAGQCTVPHSTPHHNASKINLTHLLHT